MEERKNPSETITRIEIKLDKVIEEIKKMLSVKFTFTINIYEFDQHYTFQLPPIVYYFLSTCKQFNATNGIIIKKIEKNCGEICVFTESNQILTINDVICDVKKIYSPTLQDKMEEIKKAFSELLNAISKNIKNVETIQHIEYN